MNIMGRIKRESEELRRTKAALTENLKAVFDAVDGVESLEYVQSNPFLVDETGDGDRELYLAIVGGHLGVMEIVSTVEGKSFICAEDLQGAVQIQLANVELKRFLEGYLVLIDDEIAKYREAVMMVGSGVGQE